MTCVANYLQMTLDTSKACTAFGLNIRVKTIMDMYFPPVEEWYVEPKIFIGRKRLEEVDSFIFLVSTLSKDGTLHAEINQNITKASAPFGKLGRRVILKYREKYEACGI